MSDHTLAAQRLDVRLGDRELLDAQEIEHLVSIQPGAVPFEPARPMPDDRAEIVRCLVAGLLKVLAAGGLQRGLVGLDAAAGRRPELVSRRGIAEAEHQKALVGVDHDDPRGIPDCLIRAHEAGTLTTGIATSFLGRLRVRRLGNPRGVGS